MVHVHAEDENTVSGRLARTWHVFHDDHDRLSLHSNADEAHDVGVVVLLENATLLQEFALLLVRQRLLTRLDGHLLALVNAFEHVSEVALKDHKV